MGNLEGNSENLTSRKIKILSAGIQIYCEIQSNFGMIDVVIKIHDYFYFVRLAVTTQPLVHNNVEGYEVDGDTIAVAILFSSQLQKIYEREIANCPLIKQSGL